MSLEALLLRLFPNCLKKSSWIRKTKPTDKGQYYTAGGGRWGLCCRFPHVCWQVCREAAKCFVPGWPHCSPLMRSDWLWRSWEALKLFFVLCQERLIFLVTSCVLLSCAGRQEKQNPKQLHMTGEAVLLLASITHWKNHGEPESSGAALQHP